MCVRIVTKQWNQKTSKVKTYLIVHTWKPVLLVRKPVNNNSRLKIEIRILLLHFDNLFWKISQPSQLFLLSSTHFNLVLSTFKKNGLGLFYPQGKNGPGHNESKTFGGKISKHQNSLIHNLCNKNQAQLNQNFAPLLLLF